MPIDHPESLVQHTVRGIRLAVAEGDLGSILPGESRLAGQLGISRKTLRAALVILTDEGVLAPPEPGKSRRVLENPVKVSTEKRESLGVLLPMPREEMSPGAQALLTRFENIVGGQFKSIGWHSPHVQGMARPEHHLARIVSQRHADLWVLYRPTIGVARFFSRLGLPVVACGGEARKMGISYCGFDSAFTRKHAIGVLARAGHRHLCIPARFSGSDSWKAVEDEVKLRGADKEFRIDTPVWDGDSNLLFDRLMRTFSAAERPTAIVLNGVDAMITLYSVLVQLRLRVPDDVSVLMAGSDPIVEKFRPPLTHYATPDRVIAEALAKLVLRYLETPSAPAIENLLLMELNDGRSVRTLKQS